MSPGALEAIDHVILAVRDLAAATKQYARLLGRSPSWRGEHPGSGTSNTLFRLDNTYVELLAATGPGPVGAGVAAWLAARGEGPLGLAFGTRDADACQRFFAQRGLAPDPVEKGMGRDEPSGAFRTWRRVPLPGTATRGVLLFAIEHTSPDEILTPSPPLAAPEACVHALDHAVVKTPDADAARRLYEQGLGLRVSLDRRFPEWGMRLLFLRLGEATLELAAPLDPDGSPPERDALWGLSFRVPNAEAARSRLAETGFDVSALRPGRRPGTRVFSVRDGTCGVATLMLEVSAEAERVA